MTEVQKAPVYTVGHSTHTVEKFLDLLKKSGITAVADVRSRPFSRYNPQFNKEMLAPALKGAGIAYVFVGKELGARSEDPACYEHGQVRYDKLSETQSFRLGIERVFKGTRKYRVALMCAEKEPLECHRTLLVSRALEREGVSILHILADGTVEDQSETMSRLLDLVNLPQEDMFRSRAELVSQACQLQERKVAYVDVDLAGEAKVGLKA